MGSTDQVTFANTVLLIVMGIMLILIVIGIGLFAYRYQRVQAERRQQELASLATIRFEAERSKAVKEMQASDPVPAPPKQVAAEAAVEVPEVSVTRTSRRKPSNPDNLPRHSLR